MFHIKKQYYGRSREYPHGVMLFYPRSDIDMVLACNELESLKKHIDSNSDLFDTYYSYDAYMLIVQRNKNSDKLVLEWRGLLCQEYEKWKARYRRGEA